MQPFTLDRHFTYGYGDGVFNSHQKIAGTSLVCAYSRCSREPKSFREECTLVAGELASEAAKMKRTPYLMLSGGLDSEVAAMACIDAGIDFKAITLRFMNSFNQHEIDLVERFVAETRIKHEFIDIDIVKFIRGSQALSLLHEARSDSIGMTPHMHLMAHIWEDLNGMPILGNGDVYLERDTSGWQYVELERILGWFRFAVSRKILGGVGFFQHTPEVTLAMIKHPVMQSLGGGTNKQANKLFHNSRYLKYKVYHELYPMLKARPKFGGFELMGGIVISRDAQLKSYPQFNESWKIPFKDFEELLSPK